MAFSNDSQQMPHNCFLYVLSPIRLKPLVQDVGLDDSYKSLPT